MSYILEALKKSEHERGEKKVPRITSAPPFEVEPARRASTIYIAGGAALLAVIAFVLGWMRPWQLDPAPREPRRTVAAPAQAPNPAPPREEAETRMPVRETDEAASSTLNSQGAALAPESSWKPVPRPEDETLKPSARRRSDYFVQSPPATDAKRMPPTRERPAGREKAASQATPAPEKAPAREKLAASAPEKTSATSKPGAPATIDPAQEAELETNEESASETPEVKPEPSPPSRRERRLDRKPVSPPAAPQVPAPSPSPPVTQRLPKPPERVLGFAELPPTLQAALPKITISGKGQTSDSERIAVINDRVVREGDEITSGLKLESIGENAVVLNYKGYRFYPAP